MDDALVKSETPIKAFHRFWHLVSGIPYVFFDGKNAVDGFFSSPFYIKKVVKIWEKC